MRYWVGCTITTEGTGLSCDIEIGYKKTNKGSWEWKWSRIGGRFDIGDDNGNWLHNPTNGITLVSTSVPSDPYWNNPANWLVDFDNVPDRFAEKLSCGEYFFGEGRMFLTEEKVRWKMWYPCA